jgi:hypothetical protein
MAEERKTSHRSDKTIERDAERKKRLAEALRENLRKRKPSKAKLEVDGAS